MSFSSPVIVFCYKRPRHLANTLNSLKSCFGFDPCNVTVYCDGPKCESDIPLVHQTRNVAKTILGDSATYHYSSFNKGLSASLIHGVSSTLSQHGTAIVVEDDLEFSPYFLVYMNHALQLLRHRDDIFQISGFNFHVPHLMNSEDALLLPFTVSWGWATWKKAWDHFDPSLQQSSFILNSRSARQRFNLDNSYDYIFMLKQQLAGNIDSWAIRWYLSVFMLNGLTLFPPISLVRNIGFDGSGSHGRGKLLNLEQFDSVLCDFLPDIDSGVSFDPSKARLVFDAIKLSQGGPLSRLLRLLKKLFFQLSRFLLFNTYLLAQNHHKISS